MKLKNKSEKKNQLRKLRLNQWTKLKEEAKSYKSKKKKKKKNLGLNQRDFKS